MPDSDAVTGVVVVLLVMDSVPDWLPPEVGANFTLTVQDAPAASELPQLPDWVNWPETAIDEIVAAAEPGLETVTDCAAVVEPTASSPNARLVGETVRLLLPTTEFPLVPTRVIVVGLPGWLLGMVRLPVVTPDPVGVKVTLTVQVESDARLVPQLLVCANPPVAEIEPIVAAAVAPFSTVTDWLALVDPEFTFGNVGMSGLASSAWLAGNPQVVVDQPELPEPWLMVIPEPQSYTPDWPRPVAVVPDTLTEPGA